MLKGKFHSHITLVSDRHWNEEDARALVGGKVTTIELERGDRSQADAMLTHHFVTGHHGLDTDNDVLEMVKAKAIILAQAGIKVTRVKLEYDIPSTDWLGEFTEGSYVECHVKCVVDEKLVEHLKQRGQKLDWHPSRNVYERRASQAVQFLNRRWHGDARKLSQIVSHLHRLRLEIVEICEVEEVKMEAAIYDTNEDHDRWWMLCDHCPGC